MDVPFLMSSLILMPDCLCVCSSLSIIFYIYHIFKQFYNVNV